MATTFQVDVTQIDENTSPQTIEKWDSLHHMNLILALEEGFSVQFSDKQIVESLDYKTILSTLEELTQQTIQ